MLWKAQMLTHLRSNSLLGYIDGNIIAPNTDITTTTDEGANRQTVTTVNPEFATWYVRDQTALSGFLATVTEEVLAHIMGRGWPAMPSSPWRGCLPPGLMCVLSKYVRS
jgi:hypothetical protein